MFFVGDVHGQYGTYFDWLDVFKLRKSIQVGDFGLGFGNATPKPWDMNHRFIRGNHDDPDKCWAHPNYLGDYGVTEDGILFVAGAHSIDVDWRKADAHLYSYPIWWKDEEIAESEFEKIMELYEATKPKIVVTHDCPSEIRDIIIDGNKSFRNRTSDGILSAMFKVHKPELWVFGHYHESFDSIIEGTRFKCLAELEVFEHPSS